MIMEEIQGKMNYMSPLNDKPFNELGTGIEKVFAIWFSMISPGNRWRILCSLMEMIGSRGHFNNGIISIPKNLGNSLNDTKVIRNFVSLLSKTSPNALISEDDTSWNIYFSALNENYQ